MAARTPKKPKRSTTKAATPVRPTQGFVSSWNRTEFLRKKVADQKRLLQAAYELIKGAKEELLVAQGVARRAVLASERANDKVLVMQRDMVVIDTASKAVIKKAEETAQAAIKKAEQAEHALPEWYNRATVAERDLARAYGRLHKIDNLAVRFRELFLGGPSGKPTEATWANGVPAQQREPAQRPQSADGFWANNKPEEPQS